MASLLSSPVTRPVHPCVVSLSEASRGVEFATWAHLWPSYRHRHHRHHHHHHHHPRGVPDPHPKDPVPRVDQVKQEDQEPPIKLSGQNDDDEEEEDNDMNSSPEPEDDMSWPQLVTADASTLRIYSVVVPRPDPPPPAQDHSNQDSSSPPPVPTTPDSDHHPSALLLLRLEYSLGHVAGTIIFLDTLSAPRGPEEEPFRADALVVAYAGHARVTVLTLQHQQQPPPQQAANTPNMPSSSSSEPPDRLTPPSMPAESRPNDPDATRTSTATSATLASTTIHPIPMTASTPESAVTPATTTTTAATMMMEEAVWLQATCLIDLTPVLVQASGGAVTTLDRDMILSLWNPPPAPRSVSSGQKSAASPMASAQRLACVLGGGAALVVVPFQYHRGNAVNTTSLPPDGWIALEPYVVPLASLSRQHNHMIMLGGLAAHGAATPWSRLSSFAAGGDMDHHPPPLAQQHPSILSTSTVLSTDMGEILSTAFCAGYRGDPVLLLLHSPAGGPLWSGRWGRETDGEAVRATGGAVPLWVTALSIQTAHDRTAVLWSQPVPADARELVAQPEGYNSSVQGAEKLITFSSSAGTTMVVGSMVAVIGINSLVLLHAAGGIHQVTAMNGWARASCPALIQRRQLLVPNPILKLSVSLQGCGLVWLSSTVAVLVLAGGQVYVLQQSIVPFSGKGVDHCVPGSQPGNWVWTVLPTGHTIQGMGALACLTVLPVWSSSSSSTTKREGWSRQFFKDSNGTANNSFRTSKNIQIGLLVAGSRLGDSYLLAYALESVSVALDTALNNSLSRVKKQPDDAKVKEEGAMSTGKRIKIEESPGATTSGSLEDEYERILLLEEEALYKPSSSGLNVVPPSDAEDDTATQQRSAHFSTLRALATLDCLVNLGPLGPSCEGPISKLPDFVQAKMEEEREMMALVRTSDPLVAATAWTFPCGFGSSGGVALITVPGRDDRLILAEEDCLNADALFNWQSMGVIFMGMANGGIRVLSIEKQSPSNNIDTASMLIKEVDWRKWLRDTQDVAAEAFEYSSLLGGGDVNADEFAILVGSTAKGENQGYSLIVLQKVDVDRATVSEYHELLRSPGDLLLQVSPLISSGTSPGSLSFATAWSSGEAILYTLRQSELLSFEITKPSQTKDVDVMDIDQEDDEAKLFAFYADESVVAVDLFRCPKKLFIAGNAATETVRTGTGVNQIYDEEDEELYGGMGGVFDREKAPVTAHHAVTGNGFFAAIARRQGQIEVYQIYGDGQRLELCWSAAGSLGPPFLQHESVVSRIPRSHQVSIREFRLFRCGPTLNNASSEHDEDDPFGNYCLAIATSKGDAHLYRFSRSSSASCRFDKIPLRSVARPSQEQARHQGKLLRKGMLGKTPGSVAAFLHNCLFRFAGVSGQDGLFVAGPRSFWVTSERGYPTTLFHKTRHAAPAGGRPHAVRSFCAGLTNGAFMTLHERVGRIGSQRLTLFRDLSAVFSSHGLLPGSGLCSEKIHLGVTVRRMAFIDDSDVSSGDHPLYALLVSRELEADQSTLNSDGLTSDERKRLEQEKLEAKIQKQVEADLGGFDLGNEWVEEIEREDCFKIETELGGAPPLRRSIYSLWIVDAAHKWMVVDSYELDPEEQGMALQFMTLTEFTEEPGSKSESVQDHVDLRKRHMIAVGTGTVDHNGEDVSSKGRVLLFEVKRNNGTQLAGPTVAELSLLYEKNIFHGPVASLSCLVVEGGKNRLVIGAGADVNIEQWGRGKLTQVGFFRATMQILDISPIKNFLMLSDAYDSLYFLVWRESDRSLTLLAKDYDPIAVYAAGVMNRGASMTLVCHDDRQNLQFFQYAPGEAAARGGNRLVCRADFHLGTQTTALHSHYGRSSLLVHSATPASTMAALKQQDSLFGKSDDDQRLCVHFGSTDGTLGAIVPLSEQVYWRLTALQSVMTNALETHGSLSERAWRLYRRSHRRGGCRSHDRKKGVIDGDLVKRYADLSLTDQEDLASAIGSTVDVILDNLLELECSASIL